MKSPRWVWATLGVVMVAAIGGSWKSSHDTGETNDCLINYIAQNSRVSKLRSAATFKREQAVTDLLDGIAALTLTERAADPAKREAQKNRTQAKYRELLGDYQRTTAEVAAERAKNPLPDLPEKCPEVS